MSKIVFFELEPWEKDYIKEHLRGHELVFVDKKLEENNADQYKDSDVVAVFIYSQITEGALKKLQSVKPLFP